jgi:hypothetical protein
MTEDEFNLKVRGFVERMRAKGIPSEAISLYVNDRRKEFLARTSDWDWKDINGQAYLFNKRTGEIKPYNEGGISDTKLEELLEQEDTVPEPQSMEESEEPENPEVLPDTTQPQENFAAKLNKLSFNPDTTNTDIFPKLELPQLTNIPNVNLPVFSQGIESPNIDYSAWKKALIDKMRFYQQQSQSMPLPEKNIFPTVNLPWQ